MKTKYLALFLLAVSAVAEALPSAVLNKELRIIARIESNLGQNMNHALVTMGPHRGTRAGGRWGVMPRTALHILNVSSRMNARYGYLRDMDDDAITTLLTEDESVDRAFASWLWTTLRQRFTAEQAAHAWLYGAGRTEKLSLFEIRKTAYVQSFRTFREQLHPELVEPEPVPVRYLNTRAFAATYKSFRVYETLAVLPRRYLTLYVPADRLREDV